MHCRCVLLSFLDLLYPKRSPGGTEGAWMTGDERKTLEKTLRGVVLDSKDLRRKELHHIDAVVAAGSYSDTPILRTAILTFKYKRIPSLADELAELVVRAIPGLLLPPPILWDPKDLVPVLVSVLLYAPTAMNLAGLLSRHFCLNILERMYCYKEHCI